MTPSHSFAPHLAYSAAWTPGAPEEAPFRQGAAPDPDRLGIGDFFRLAASHAFERTTSGLFLEETRIAQAEEKAGTDWDPAEAIGGSDVAVTLPQDLADFANPRALSEAEFRAAGLDRGGRIAWMPTTTRQRAEIEAETLDRRQREARLLELNSDTLGRKVVGFGAAFLANVPDPINLVPIYGAGTAGATFGARVLRGATEGLAGTALADMALVPAANRRGDAVGFADVALDLTFGGLCGGGFGTASGLLHNRRAAGLAGEQNRLAELLGEAGYESADAGRLAASAIAHIADVPRRKELSDAVRRNLAGMDRLGAGKLLDRMMIAIRDGEAPDVGKWMQELGLHKAFALGEKIRREQVELAAAYDRVLHQPLGGSQDEVLATLAPEDIERVLVHRGPAVLKDGEISVQGRALKQAGLSKRGFGLVKVIFLHGEKGTKRQEMPRVQREDVINMPRTIREYAPITHEVGTNGDGVTRWNIPRADGNYLAIVVGRGQDGPDSRLVSMFVDSPEGPASPKRNRPESLLPSARLGEGYMADGLGVLSDSASPDGKNSIAESSASVVSPNRNTSQGISRFTPDGQDGVIGNVSSGSRIDVDSASVNVRAVSDFTAPAPKTVIKSVYQEKTGEIGKRLDRKKEPVREGGHSSISVGDESPLAAGRLSDLQTDSVAPNISTSRSIVNVAEFHSDFTAPAPEPKIMPHALDRATRADAKMFDAEEFGALDMDVSRIAEEGRMMPEYAAELKRAEAELKRVDNLETAGLAVLKRVLGGLE